eukprot:5479766-Pyramimonas_sp.AAC.1
MRASDTRTPHDLADSPWSAPRRRHRRPQARSVPYCQIRYQGPWRRSRVFFTPSMPGRMVASLVGSAS